MKNWTIVALIALIVVMAAAMGCTKVVKEAPATAPEAVKAEVKVEAPVTATTTTLTISSLNDQRAGLLIGRTPVDKLTMDKVTQAAAAALKDETVISTYTNDGVGRIKYLRNSPYSKSGGQWGYVKIFDKDGVRMNITGIWGADRPQDELLVIAAVEATK